MCMHGSCTAVFNTRAFLVKSPSIDSGLSRLDSEGIAAGEFNGLFLRPREITLLFLFLREKCYTLVLWFIDICYILITRIPSSLVSRRSEQTLRLSTCPCHP